MPIVKLTELPDSSRVWIYGADSDMKKGGAEKLLTATDEFLARWTAHGKPLTSGREWSDDRFLTIAVDQEQEGASGCSIDGLFRTLNALEPELGVKLVTSGLVYFRARDGKIHAVTRDEFTNLATAGDIDVETEVFDLSVVTLGELRARFRSRAGDSWHVSLFRTPA